MPPADKPKTEIAIAPAMHSGSRVAAIVPTTWAEVVTIASSICRANMAPKSYLDKQGAPIPDKVAVAIMHGLEVGFTPMAALQSIAVINGMPSVYGDGLLALIRASGLLEDCQEDVEWGKDGPLSATCKMWRKGEKSPSVQTYTRADAINARLWGKQGPWTDHPARMLQWRARGWCGRDKFADVLRGLRSAEEVEDMVDITPAGSATTTPPTEPKRADFQDQPSPAAANGEPTKDGQPATSPPAGAGGDSKPEAAGKPAPITDVKDENEALPVFEFEKFTKVVPFIEFSNHFLDNEGNNANGATQWLAFYKTIMDETIANPKTTEKTRAAFAMLQAMAEERMAPTREPGEEG